MVFRMKVLLVYTSMLSLVINYDVLLNHYKLSVIDSHLHKTFVTENHQ